MNRHATLSMADTGSARDPVRWRVLAVLLTTIFMSLIDVSIVNVAIPSIKEGLNASLADVQWVLSGYALTFGVVLVAAGRAGDILGRGGLFIIGVGIFTLSSVAAGLAPDARWLDGARFVQGVGSGILNPQAIGMIQQYFRGQERGRAFGWLGTTVGVSVAIGPVLGGVLIKLGGVEFGWRLAFLVNLPVGIIAVALAAAWFPRPLFGHAVSARAAAGAGAGKPARTFRSLDPIGSLLLGLAVLALLFPFVEYRAAATSWLLLPSGLVLVWAWVRWERHQACIGRSPMVNLDLFSTRSFSNGILIMSLYFLGMTSIWVLIALYVQDGLGMSALQTGLIGMPSAIVSALSANWAGRRVLGLGRKVVVGGLLFGLLGLALSAAVVLLHEHDIISVWWLLLTLCFVGVAQGSVISPNQTLTLADVPLEYAGSSGAVMQTGQRIGTSVGIAVITAAVFAVRARAPWSVAVSTGFGVIAVVVLMALVVAVKDLRDRRRRPGNGAATTARGP